MKQKFIEEVGHQMMIVRKDNKISIEQLSEITGVATSTISRYENAKGCMDIDMIEKLVNGCGMSLDIFFKQVVAKMQQN